MGAAAGFRAGERPVADIAVDVGDAGQREPVRWANRTVLSW
ncbi:hypothetical protein ABIA38_006562 [Embleya sp. AB8]